MIRLSSRLVAALLWCAIALLPLRALAASAMSAERPTGELPAAVAFDQAGTPCHGAVGADEGGTQHLCTACDLCHAGVAITPATTALGSEPNSMPPNEALPSHHGRVAPDGLFRPPR